MAGARQVVRTGAVVAVAVEQLAEDGAVLRAFGALLHSVEGHEPELLPAPAGPALGLAVGARVRMRRTVPADATYVQHATVMALQGDGTVRLRPDDDWVRCQQRGHVRVPTTTVDVQLWGDAVGPDTAPRAGRACDLSAGGMRVRVPSFGWEQDSRTTWELGTVVRARFELPDEARGTAVELRARIVRAVPDADHQEVAYGLMFLDVTPALDRRLTQWVFRQEAKQRHARYC